MAAPFRRRAAFAAMRLKTAELSYRSEQSNHTLALSTLGARLSRRALVVVFSDFVDATTAGAHGRERLRFWRAATSWGLRVRSSTRRLPPRRKGRRATCAEVAEAVSAAQMLRERRAVFERMGRLGIEVVEAAPGQLVASVLSAYLRIKLAGTI